MKARRRQIVATLMGFLVVAVPLQVTATDKPPKPKPEQYPVVDFALVGANITMMAWNGAYISDRHNGMWVPLLGVASGVASLYWAQDDSAIKPTVLKASGLLSIFVGVIGAANTYQIRKAKSSGSSTHINIRPVIRHTRQEGYLGFEFIGRY